MKNKEIIFEQEISLIDILVRTLRIWKRALLAAAIGAILLGGYAVFTNMNAAPVLVMTSEQIAEAETKIAGQEALITTNEGLITSHEDAIANLEDSVDANILSIADKKAEITRIKESVKKLEALEAVYQEAVDVTLTQKALDDDFTAEVLTLTGKIAETQSAIYDHESRIAILTTEIASLENINEDDIPAQAEEYTEEIETLNSDNESIQAEIDTLKAEMAETQVPEFSVVKVVAFAIIGAVLGLMVIPAYIAVVLAFDGKLHNASALEENFGLYLLGSLQSDEESKRKNTLVDKLIKKLSNSTQSLGIEEEKGIITAKIKTLSKTSRVMAIGTIDEESIQKAVQDLQSLLGIEKIEFIASGNPMYSTESMNLIKDYELVLIEKADKTDSRELSKLIQFLKISEATVLGVIEGA